MESRDMGEVREREGKRWRATGESDEKREREKKRKRKREHTLHYSKVCERVCACTERW